MRGPRPTVERLDQPSAYFANRVSVRGDATLLKNQWATHLIHATPLATSQNKRRRLEKEQQRDGDGDSNAHNDQPEEDPLKNATTLYVGNL